MKHKRLYYILMLICLMLTLIISGCAKKVVEIKEEEAVINQSQQLAIKDITSSISREMFNQIRSNYAANTIPMPETDGNTEVEVIVTIGNESVADMYFGQNRYGTLGEFVSSQSGKTIINSMLSEQNVIKNRITEADIAITYKREFTTLLNGFGAIVKKSDIQRLEAIEGVISVAIAEQYNAPMGTNGLFDSMQSTGIFKNESEYKGERMLVAIVDTGLDYTHSAFASNPKRVNYSEAQINTIIEEAYLGGKYYSAKVPYMCDYADGDNDVYPTEDHGTHVAGIVAGNNEILQGVAPEAQLAIMKVFADGAGGASSLDILAAVSDCAILGVDVINMSLGSSCGFAEEYGESYQIFNNTYNKIENLGITLCISAGNDYYSSVVSNYQGSLSSCPDASTVGSPSTYNAALSVAAANSTPIYYIVANNEQGMMYNNAVNMDSVPYDFTALLGNDSTGKYEYVYIPGTGTPADFDGYDVNGKIAVILRGDISFEEKQKNAADMGAIACIIGNNVEGEINMQIENLVIPSCSVNLENIKYFIANPVGYIEMGENTFTGPDMASYSGWGPTSSGLHIKPEITAPGSNIYSSIIGEQYASYDGTSMASPNMAGLMAVARQYLREKFPALSELELNDLCYAMAMSTADTVYDKYGLPAPVRKQGAGMANIQSIMNTGAYLTVTGSSRPKAELGQDKKKTGIYTIDFNVVNFSDKTISYCIDAITVTDTVINGIIRNSSKLLYGNGMDVSVRNGKYENGVLFVEANSTAKLSVTITLTTENKNYIKSTFENGMFVEGFIKLNNTNKQGVNLSIPWLAFFGDYDALPVFQSDIYDDELALNYETMPVAAYMNEYLLPLGYFPYILPDGMEAPAPEKEKIALSQLGNTLNNIYSVFTGLYRNVDRLDYYLVDKWTEEVIWSGYANNVRKTYYSTGSGQIIPLQHDLELDVYSLELANNQQLEFKMVASYYNDENTTFEYSFPIYIDSEAPVLLGAKKLEWNEETFLVMSAYDNRYLCNAQFLTPTADGKYTALLDYPIPISGSDWGENFSLSLNITGLLDKIYDDTILIVFEDYALNQSAFIVNFGEDSGEEEPEEPVETEGFIIVDGVLVEYNGTDADVVIPDNVVTIGPNAFKKAKNIVNTVIIPEGVESIMDNAFRDCVNLRYCLLPESLKSLGNSVWYGCTNLQYMSLPAGVETMGHVNWYGCTSLKAFSFWAETPKGIGGGEFQNVPQTTPLYVPKGSLELYNKVNILTPFYGMLREMTSDYEMNGKVITKYIGNNSDAVIVPGVTEIADNAFIDNQAVTSVTLCTANKIGANAFKGCTSLKKINISNEITSIGDNAFDGCKALESIEFTNKEPFAIGNNVFANVNDSFCIYVPADSKAKYLSNESWKQYEGLIKELIFIVEGTKLIGYKGTNLIVVIPENVTDIADNAFAYNPTIEVLDLSKSAVRNIGKMSFMECTNLKEIIFNNTIEYIGIQAFYKCSSLSKLIIPESIKKLDNLAFLYCTNLSVVDFPGANPVEFGFGMFLQCSKNIKLFINESVFEAFKANQNLSAWFNNMYSLAPYTIEGNILNSYTGTDSTVAFPASVEIIGSNAFKNNTTLAAINFDGIVEIKDNAFDGCSSVKDLTLPESITSIGNQAFINCTNLDTVNIKSIKPFAIGEDVFDNTNPALKIYIPRGTYDAYIADESWNQYKDFISEIVFEIENGVLKSYAGTDKVVVIPEKVTEIGEGVFSDNSTITEIVLPQNLKTIGNEAFNNCINLISINLPDSLVTIGDRAFYGCSALSSDEFILPMGLSTIGEAAFAACASFESIIVPATVSKMGEYVFNECSNLKYIEFQTGMLTYLPDYTCYKCTSLETLKLSESMNRLGFSSVMFTGLEAIYLPASVAVLDGQAFTYSDIQIITCGGDIAPVANTFTFFTYYYTSLRVYVKESAFEAYKSAWSQYGDKFIPDYSALLVSMKDFEINENKTLVKYNGNEKGVAIPVGAVNAVGENAFKGNANLYRAYGFSFLTEIGNSAFEDCTELLGVEFLDLESIGSYAFKNCKKLESIELNEKINFIGDGAFANSGLKEIKINSKSVPEMAGNAFEGLTDYTIWVPENCKQLYTKNEAWAAVADHIQEINNFNIIDGVLYEYYGEESEIYIPDGVTAIAGAFKEKAFIKVVHIPDSVTAIMEEAFYNCTGLESIIIPDSVTEIGDSAFENCKNLKEVKLSKNVKILKNTIFANCISLKEIEVPYGVEQLWGGVFFNTGLVEIELPETVTFIYMNSLSYMPALKKLTINGRGLSLYNVVVNNQALEEVHLNGCFYNIGGEDGKDFAACNSIKTIEINADIKSISGNAFAYMANLESVIFNGNIETIEYHAFNTNAKLTKVQFNADVGFISGSAFNGSLNLKQFTVGEDNKYLTVDEYGVLYNKEMTRVYRQPDGWDYDGTYVMPNTVTEIDEFAFSSDKDFLIGILFDGVTWIFNSIGYYHEKTALKGVVLSENLDYIPYKAFRYAVNLSEINLEKVEAIEENAFEHTAIKEVSLGNSFSYIGRRAFANSDVRTINISKDAVEFVLSDIFYGCENIETVNAEEGNKSVVTENGVVFNADKTVLYLYGKNKQDKEYTVPSTVLKIAAYAFKGNKYLEVITIPESVKAIGDKAFYGTENLTEYHFLGNEAPTLECIFNEDYTFWYANFYDYVETLSKELTIYHPVDGKHYYNLIWSSFFANRKEVNEDGSLVEDNENNTSNNNQAIVNDKRYF